MPKLAAGAVALTLILQPLAGPAGPPVVNVAAGAYHSLFSKSDGSLWSMGYNAFGQLGVGASFTKTNVPQQVVSSGVGAVAGGAYHSLFRMSHGVWVMGYNFFGQLGDGTTTDRSSPERIFNGSIDFSATVIAGGDYHSLFGTSGIIIGSETLRATGQNHNGQLGDGTYTNRDTPEVIVSDSPLAVAAGGTQSLFIKSDGSLWGMGYNADGELGLGPGAPTFTNIPVEIAPGGVTAIAAGWNHTLFVKSGGSLWAMGTNSYGQLGDSTTTTRFSPEEIASSGVTAVAAGACHSLFIKSDGSLWGMGCNSYGQLGDGTTNDHHVVVQIVASNVVAVAAGAYHSLFITVDGSLWGMGNNGEGELGEGSYTNHLSPVRIVLGIPPQPRITGIVLSGSNLKLTGANGVAGEILYTLMATNVTLGLNQWQRVATNTLGGDGNFSITATNAVNAGDGHQFYTIQAQ